MSMQNDVSFYSAKNIGYVPASRGGLPFDRPLPVQWNIEGQILFE